MRAYLASSIAVTCAAALALPLALTTPAGAAAAPAVPPVLPAGTGAAGPAGDLAGSTQSLPLEPLADPETPSHGRTFGRPDAPTGERGLTRRDVRPFSLVGVVWDDTRAQLHGTVQVRTRATADGLWSDWQDVETHNEEHGADPGTAEGRSGALRGATAPLWVGDSDGVEIRVRPESQAAESQASESRASEPQASEPQAPESQASESRDSESQASESHAAQSRDSESDAPQSRAPEDRSTPATPASPVAPTTLPAGLRLELVDPGPDPDADPDAAPAPAAGAARTSRAALAPAASVNAVLPALTRAQTLAALPAADRAALAAKPYIGPRPKIITRKGWGADEKMRERAFVYTKTIKAAFVHHSATGNNYTCKQAPSVLRSIYRYHVKSLGWRDFGYNFAVDKCGNIYEGRAGGVAKAVLGAHTLGFNTNSMGVAVLGTYGSTTPPAAVVTAVAKLTAWKLGLHGVNPKGKVTLTSGGGNRYKKGSKVKFNAIAGHRDGFATECPGGRLYNKLGTARSDSAKYQGRR
ncbi:N-acetylmuramoyl-L-alanine amidase [Streptomyces sp. NPDC048623]|uniref:peptidoglycan recognition protein family protein n=1 Tax=Streptomyces sp. NPDC048623 TaxID=3155761 RepID=UPI00342FDD69